MARPAKWNSPTDSVRLPKHAIEACIALAKSLDQPLPTHESDPLMDEYLSFVQNASQPRLFSVLSAGGSSSYLMQVSPPPTFEEYKILKQLEEEIEKRVFAGFSRDERLYLLSCMIEEVFPRVDLDNARSTH